MQHIAGVVKLNVPEGLVRVDEAVELNKESQRVLSTFGDQEFVALVGFIDMRGFSGLSQGKTPREVQAIAAPFIAAVVDVAHKHRCIIDKTNGDEVMIVMPEFGADAVCSDAGLDFRGSLLAALSSLIADLTHSIGALVPVVHFSCCFAKGRLVLGNVGSGSFSEWTVYGNVVNAAKRIQSEQPADARKSSNVLSVGAIDADEPGWADELRAWESLNGQAGLLRMLSPVIHTKELEGVGKVTFLSSDVAE